MQGPFAVDPLEDLLLLHVHPFQNINLFRNNIIYELYRGLKFNYEDEL